ncbi:hypothetical protein [Xylanimonas ulmi]|uniref:NurA domain-containing protein n=1 Tax=Xylanimonas ulmi TaxID=228973 RepID=A0A4Q7M2M8_9MICO|nr:hypothetical protein [Xylanibacterium ulmi]RZS60718.1 hypothetical protein EV386_0993 [Xylanibacterium ulmi]
MPYETVGGGFELASRTGHAEAVLRSMADQRSFFVPAERVTDLDSLSQRVRRRSDMPAAPVHTLRAALAIDGSRMPAHVRDGLPSVVYGFAQAAAAYLDLQALENQRAVRFVDPVVLEGAVNRALVSLDLPCAGAYEREGVDIKRSWREAVDRIFRTKRVEVNNLNLTLLDLLCLLYGAPGVPATSIEIDCQNTDCKQTRIAVPAAVAAAPIGFPCPACDHPVFPTDILGIHDEVVEEGTNETSLGRLMSVVELLVLVGLVTLLWRQHRADLLPETLFIVDGPLAVMGPPAPLRYRALRYFQAMGGGPAGHMPYIVGVEKTGPIVDFARRLLQHDVLAPGELLVCDARVIGQIYNTDNALGYGKETYWGRKFIYRTADGRVLVPTFVPPAGRPYDRDGGLPDPSSYPQMAAILDVFDRTGSSMYQDGIIPTALAHGSAAFPIGVGTDVLKLVARRKLGLDDAPRHARP